MKTQSYWYVRAEYKVRNHDGVKHYLCLGPPGGTKYQLLLDFNRAEHFGNKEECEAAIKECNPKKYCATNETVKIFKVKVTKKTKFKPVKSIEEIDIDKYAADLLDNMNSNYLQDFAFLTMVQNIKSAPQEQTIQEYNDFYST